MKKEAEDQTSNQPTKLPFLETPRIYREGVERLLAPMLEGESHPVLKLLEKGQPVYLPVNRTDYTRLIPIAMPINYKFRKENHDNAHNMAQLYFYPAHQINKNGDFRIWDEGYEEIGQYYGLSDQVIGLQVRHATRDVIDQKSNKGIVFQDLNFRKPLGFITRKIRALSEYGASYDDLRKAGYNSVQIMYARRLLKARGEKVKVPNYSDKFVSIVEKLEDPEIDREVKRELLNKLPREMLYKYNKGDKRILVTISEVARAAGLNPSKANDGVKSLTDHLFEKQFPIRQISIVVKQGKHKGKVLNYRFMLAEDFEAAKKEFEEAQGEVFDRMRGKA